jgi:hypothetical protein
MAEKVKMTLVGLDGNAFSLMGAFSKNAKEQGWTKEEISNVINRCTSGDYDNLISTLMENIDDEDLDYDEDYDFDVELEDLDIE